MSPKKSPKKQPPELTSVDFKTWKTKVVPYLRSPGPEGQALHRWLEKHAADLTSVGNTDGAQRDLLLERLYHMTSPRRVSEGERKKHEAVTASLTTLLPKIKSALEALDVCSRVVPIYGFPPQTIALTKLSGNLEEAAFYIERARLFLDYSYQSPEDAISHCLYFIGEMRSYKVPEPKVVALCQVIMRAHGFADDELVKFSINSQRDGTPRKASRKMIAKFGKVLNSVFELHGAYRDKYLENETVVLMEQKNK